MPNIAVVGGGINGAGIAWEIVRRGYDVTLFEQGRCGEQTSSATTKLIHGGIRYLERFHFGLVRESLRERAWLLEHLPQLVKPIEILLPVYGDSPRNRFTLRAGLMLYDALAGSGNIHPHAPVSVQNLLARVPLLERDLRGGFSFWDAQTDDHALVRTVVASAVRDGARIREQTRVLKVRRDRDSWLMRTSAGPDEERFDFVVNAAGPWMNELLGAYGMRTRYRLSLVRGSHIVLRHRVSETGMLLQSAGDRRVFFVLPWKETTLVGTTEVMHREPLKDVRASEQEVDYLISRFNRYVRRAISRDDVASTFAGVRPLVGRSSNPSVIGREYRIERHGNLIHVFGGKMTTFMALARNVAMRVDNHFGSPREAKEPRFAI